ncbi:MAG: DNA polymerase III subunit chi [Gammaproteobacteria bacterium]|nr:DNA polymerase III subunit chi [Gammaproteobacteria bacterium]
MTRIDFYQLNPDRHRADTVVCQLCQKAYEGKQKTFLLTNSAEQTEQLDRQLWVFRDDSFVPHDTELVDSFDTPILLSEKPQPDCQRQLLINLTDTIPSNFAQYERIIELVTEDNKQQARKHYSFYKERGYPLNHHNL